ncbi:MAG TPA: glucan endo-1,3-beta-D-glucosidase [Candidatus Marinimicrobia bacterium]|nr:glucan endo-1,3-beta-D-glucosidase [Candidatus Neomarinimicrobiota bacterium]
MPVHDGWELVWNDEFDGDTIDLNKWEYEVNAQGGGNNELQYYTDRPQNSRVKDGLLTIQALQETFTGPEGTREYTSARLRTKNRGDWKYGRFEIKAKLPYGQGLWPAIWMLPTDWVYGGWAASGEIDIMELVGHDPAAVYGTLHYGGTYPDNVHTGASYKLSFGNFALDFHVFALEWSATEMRWFVDDSLYQVQTEWYSQGNDYPAPFNQRFHLLLNVAVGGNWPGNPDNTTSFPQRMEVDYVRVYQKTD